MSPDTARARAVLPGAVLLYSGGMMAKDREFIEPNEDDKRYTRRDEEGRFTEDQDDVSRSLSRDVREDAKTETRKGQGDRGDRAD